MEGNQRYLEIRPWSITNEITKALKLKQIRNHSETKYLEWYIYKHD